ncbi:hypothetical protein DQ353_12510 [Arthrobacter sp. AQ5-05]|uniref:recombinase family protein n=1 Tax=Arthrobacter sp. AQ5-05 TaxID=2184581 RepID=UPI000DCCA99B|nr:recombinase family protein [Arthrobacter sp. AQ5-05]RAX48935.1 hypothetical protein DQ353_12510 [Arthrobacter sp. AQ5-05]
MFTALPRAVLYLRLSAVVDDSTSLVRQEKDLRAEATRRGWDVVAVLADEGISGRKSRAKATEAVRMIADDEADVLAVWKLDRFTRQGWDGLGELTKALDDRAHKARKRSCTPALFVALQDGLTSDQSAFRMIAGVLSEVARSEADNAAKRITNSIAYRKTQTHKYAGGSAIPYGYRSIPAPDGIGRVLVHDDAEVEIVREVAQRLIDGVEPLLALARDLNAREIPTSKSPARRAIQKGESPVDSEGQPLATGEWRAATFRNLWTADTFLGRVVHHGDFIRDADGLPAEVWPPILTRSVVDAIRRRLNWTPRPGSAAAKHWHAPVPVAKPQRKRAARLLSGVAFCAECDGKMYVTTSSGKPIYACSASRNGRECRSPKINAEGLEKHVSAEFLRFAGTWPEYEVVTETTASATEAQLAEVEAALREATGAMLDDDADVEALTARLATLKARRTELRAAPSTTSTSTRPTGRTLADAWEADPRPEWRRSVLLNALDHLTVAPTISRRSPIDPARVAFYWNS